VGNWLGPVTKIVLAALVVAYVVRVIRLRRARRKGGSPAPAGEPSPAREPRAEPSATQT
jgi:hypothetical protein